MYLGITFILMFRIIQFVLSIANICCQSSHVGNGTLTDIWIVLLKQTTIILMNEAFSKFHYHDTAAVQQL